MCVPIALVVVNVSLWMPSAQANYDCLTDNGSPGGVQDWWCPESNSQRYWTAGTITADWLTAANNSRTQDINPTDMNTTVVSGHDNSDVAVYGYTYDDNRAGFTQCIDTSGNICLHWHVLFKTNSPHTSMAHKDWVACQEFGHATGLHHQDNDPGDSCMNSSHIHVGVFDNHDLYHINTQIFPP
jgi:hypothetical protein